ncbi:deazaflavin-dependent oxidoreductase (nitroreductase family) [Pseudonocardia sediminis]|uniref:Deazaflavin-dependent oxidoreductase (Nitroreductase family) n=1 Tax=Pseudonocardia sediminis TaxID=1397368 RepID=A0A4Q7V356_PSEST|nr:nitroreductase family deazaflavin-dependent oxidoreductase [Pseudonocardia sediminis]RZT87019.1 deazaflavin-dependent oxidoreductase (nitroreductase family) [Pseudonocardia sediminis]
MSNPFEEMNNRVISEFRENDGKVGPPFEGATMILVHHLGAKSGTERITPLVWFPDGDRFVIVASKAGAPDNPAWYHNLVAHPDITVEVGHGPEGRTETLDVHAEELTGSERERIWSWITENNEGFADYQKKVEGVRTIPLFALGRR